MKAPKPLSRCFWGTVVLLALLRMTPANSQELSSLEVCQQGQLECVDKVIEEMERWYESLVQIGDPDALFALNYLRTTEAFQDTFDEIGYSNPAAVIREDALFADYYFRNYDNYHSGTSSVPPAWQIAFEAAETRSVTGLGHVALGINAHINRDLPFVLYELDLQDRPVSYEDHVRVNQFLQQVDVFDELALLDPTINDFGFPEAEESFQAIVEWREGAFRNFERLQEAPTQTEFTQVAGNIEADSAALAASLLQVYRSPDANRSSIPEPDANLGLYALVSTSIFGVRIKVRRRKSRRLKEG